jgi:Xaa-Pro aminopeptidase
MGKFEAFGYIGHAKCNPETGSILIYFPGGQDMWIEEEICELTPGTEIQERIRIFREKMARAGVNFSIIMENADLFYFSGTTQKGMLVIPLESDPLLFVEKNQERAQRESPLPVIPISRNRDIRDILNAKGILRGKGGMELDVLPVTYYERFRQNMAFDSFVDISPLIRKSRMIKSDFEIRQIMRSGEIIDSVFSRAREILREGLREIDVEAELTAEGRRRGHQGLLRMHGFNQEMMCLYVISGQAGAIPTSVDVTIAGLGLTAALPQGSSFKVIRRDQPVILDYGGAYNGYITDETRSFVIGSLSEKFIKAHEVAREILEDIMTFAGEGVESTQLFERAQNMAKAKNLDEYFMGYGAGKAGFIGHGLGLELNELPVITPCHPQTLAEGMVFAVEPKFVFPGEGGIGVEADFVIRRGRLERITKTPLDLVQL